MCFCAFVLVCGGPICMIVGIVFLVKATTDTRGELIKPYNAAVDAWTSQYRAAFVNAGLSFASSSAGTFTTSTSADTTWSSDSDNGNGLHSYTPFKYKATATNFQTAYISYTCTGCASGATTQNLGTSGAGWSRSASSTNYDQSQCNNLPACQQDFSWCTWDARRRRTD